MIYILLFILLFASELAYFKLADRYNIIDKPNQRSSHTQVTLRGGGLIFYIGILFYFISEGFQYPWFFAGLTLISIISFADDIKPRSFKIRLVIHFSAIILMFCQWNLFELPWYYAFFALVFCTGILNAYNFMDGINGITGGYSLIITGALCYINLYQVSFVDNDLIYAFILALLVFSFFNFRAKAKCFAGDVGSISAAFIIVFLLGKLIAKTLDFSYIVLLAVYGVDAVLTIIHRILLKENIFKPHRKHLYQLLANEMKINHLIVTTIYMILQGLIAFGLFVVQNRFIYSICVIIILTLIYLFVKLKCFCLYKT